MRRLNNESSPVEGDGLSGGAIAGMTLSFYADVPESSIAQALTAVKSHRWPVLRIVLCGVLPFMLIIMYTSLYLRRRTSMLKEAREVRGMEDVRVIYSAQW